MVAMPTLADVPAGSSPQLGGNAINFSRYARQGRRLTPTQIRTIEAVQGKNDVRKSFKIGGNRLSSLSTTLNRRGIAPKRANASGSIFEGWRIKTFESQDPNGWYSLDENANQNLLWEFDGPIDESTGDKIAFPFTTGFVRDGKIYAIGSSIFIYWSMVEYGIFTRDGELLQYLPAADMSDDMSKYVMSVAYDAATDRAYVYTLNAAGDNYMFQSIDPETWEYTPIKTDVTLKEVCNGLALDPRNGKLIGLTPENKIVSIDPATGQQTILKENPDLMPIEKLEAMVYSPYDNAFVFVRPDDYGYDTRLCYIDADTYELTTRTWLNETKQYPILITPNTFVTADAPGLPTLVSMNFVPGEDGGTAIVTLPSTTFSGQPLSGTLELNTVLDGADYSTVSGEAGTDVTVTFANLSGGMHRMVFTPRQEGRVGQFIEAMQYTGFDTPLAPQNIQFTETSLTWDAVTQTVHGGALDHDALYYNVYLDGTRLNTEPVHETSYAITIPDGKYATHIAAVECVNHEFTSALGYSNTVNAGQAMPLPQKFSPTAEQAALFTALEPNGIDWKKWSFSDDCFLVYTTAYNDADAIDEWLFLPPLDIPETDMMISAMVRVQTGSDKENLTLCYGDAATPEAMHEAVTHTGLNYEEYATIHDYFVAPHSGKLFLAYKTRKGPDGYRIGLNNFYISVSKIAKTAPAAPVNLTATAAPQGALRANVEFDMPTLDVSGNALADADIEATVTCGKVTATATGRPGTHQNVEIEAPQGQNEITVTAGGLESKTGVYVGLDIPSPLADMKVDFTPDNLSMIMSWEAPTTGINGGYIDPEAVTYSLCEYNPETYEWEVTRNLAGARTFTYTATADTLALSQAGILTQNTAGNAGIFRSTLQTLGRPVAMPVVEDFSDYTTDVEPIYVEMPTDEYTDGVGNMDVSYMGVEGGKPSLSIQGTPKYEHSYARVCLPKVSLEGAKNPAIELNLYCGPEAGKLTVTAQSYGDEPVEIGSFQEKSETPHMQRVRFLIPEQFKQKGWVALKLNGEFQSSMEGIYIDYIKISDCPDADVALTSLRVPEFLMTGKAVNVKATVTNYGLKPQMIPALSCQISSGERVIATLPLEAVDAPDLMEPLTSLNYTLTYTPDVEAGDNELTFKVTADVNDQEPTNNAMSADCIISRGNQPLITDLKAEATGDNQAELTWTEPVIEDGHEGFENFTSFCYYDQMGDFTAIDADGMETTYVDAYELPGSKTPKAFQVFSAQAVSAIAEAAGYTNGWCRPAEGDKMIMAFVPYTVYVGSGLKADDWLVSPRLVAGSEFSFQAIPVFGGTENIEIWTGTEPDINTMTILSTPHPFGNEWTKYNLTLPEGHTYFAIRYVSDTDGGLVLGLDDFRYVKDGPTADKIVGYDIFRSGALMAEAQPCQGLFADNDVPVGTTYYNIRPVLQGANGQYRGAYSNTAFAAVTSLDALMNGENIYGATGTIEVRGHQGQQIEVFDLTGRRIATTHANGNTLSIPVAAGLYTVRTASGNAKVIVK